MCLSAPQRITGIDIGNFWSASIEIQVGLSEWPLSRREEFLKENIIMNRIDCSVGDNKQKMMFFREAQFNPESSSKKWDRVKIICKQPFKINNDSFGLAMFVLHGEKERSKEAKICDSSGSDSRKNMENSELSTFKKKTLSTFSSSKAPYVPSVLKSLENTKKFTTENSENRAQISNVSSKSMSRTAQLVIKGQSTAGKKMTFDDEAKEFLRSCQFETKPFAELESITFRHVKELWMKRKKSSLSKEEKDVLKKMSAAYLTKLVTKTNSKRPRDASDEKSPLKKRKISRNIENLRRNTEIDDLYDDEGGSSNLRNSIATRDVVKKADHDEEDEDLNELRQKYNINPEKKNSTPFSSKQDTKTSSKKPDLTQPTFDLTSSPDMSPVKEASPKKVNSSFTKISESGARAKPQRETEEAVFDLTESPKGFPVQKDSSIKTAPRYNRKHLLSVSHEVLIKNGILVQVYNYKKDKKLPLKGKLEISVKKGTEVTFFKVGPDTHLEYQDRFYLPDIQPEHLERVFKNFKPSEINCCDFPSNLETLLQLTSKNQIQDTPKDHKSDQIPSKSSSKKSEAKTVAPERGQCPLCEASFSLESLEEHAATCRGRASPDLSSGWVFLLLPYNINDPCFQHGQVSYL